MTVSETELPGVGKKHEIDLGDGETLVILTHNSGRREVYKRPSPDADSEKLFDLPDQLARTVGTILEGAYFQPVEHDAQEAMLPGGAMIEWFEVIEGSSVVGKTLGEMDFRAETGASVVTIQRGESDVIASPGPDTALEVGDTLIVVGDRESVEALGDHLGRPIDER